jgi:hypothetical protein
MATHICRRVESNALAFTSVELDLRNYFDFVRGASFNPDAMPADHLQHAASPAPRGHVSQLESISTLET